MASPTTTLEGVLALRRVGVGSKGEMPRVVLVPDGAPDDAPPIPLRLAGATRLDADPAFTPWLGRAVRVHGRQAFATFVVERIEAR